MYLRFFIIIHADDHSRVKLKDAKETDYINANFVECKKAQKKYILAQVSHSYARLK